MNTLIFQNNGCDGNRNLPLNAIRRYMITPTLSGVSRTRTLSTLLIFLLACIMLLTVSPAAFSQGTTVVEVGSGTIDRDREQGPRWVRLNFNALAAGTHTATVSWNSGADVRFNVFTANGTRVSSSVVQGTNPGVWSGELFANERYYLALWSASGSADYTATVQASVPVSIESQPTDLELNEGEDATFTVAAVGGGTLSYQWFVSTTDIAEDGTFVVNPAKEIVGATSDTLIVSSVTLAESLSAYLVEVSSNGGSVMSDIAILTVEAVVSTASISMQPADLTVIEGEDATFTVAATGEGVLSYQWFAGDVAIDGATSSILIVSAATSADADIAYSVVINDDNGSITSNAVTLIVNEVVEILTIVEQPVDLTVTEGDNAIFSVAAGGSGVLSYQWFVDTRAIDGATSDTLTISPATLSDSGTGYSVVISDENGSIDSSTAILVVDEDVVIPTTVVSIGQGTLDADSNLGPRRVRINFDALSTATHTITVSFDSDADVRFSVFDASGTAISNSVVQGSNPGVWSGVLNDNNAYYISLWSNEGIANYNAIIEANVAVSIGSQPNDLVVTEGDNATFMVSATGSGTLGYQWLANGISLPGETSDTLTVFATSISDDGAEYTVEVSNGFDVVTSDMAVLTVNESLLLGLFSQEADTSAWMLEGPAPTLDYVADVNSGAWGEVLLRIGDVLLVGGDFDGIKPTRNGTVTPRPFLAALDAVTGQPVSTFQVPFQVDSVVRALVLSPSGKQVYIGGDFGLLVLDATTGEVDTDISVTKGNEIGRVFDIAVTDTQIYIGGDFNNVDNTFRANIARLTLDGELDLSWSPNVTHGFSAGRSAPVQTIAVSSSGDTVYVGGNFGFIEGVAVDRTAQNKKISLLAVSANDETVQAERFSAQIGNSSKALQVHDIAVTDSYVIVAWGSANFLTFHALSGNQLKQYRGKGDVQSLQIVGNHLFVGHHGEFFGSLPNPIPQEALVNLEPEVLKPFKFHSFRIDDPRFPPEQAWPISGAFGVWGIAAAEDSIWLAGQMFKAGLNERPVDGLVRFPALD